MTASDGLFLGVDVGTSATRVAGRVVTVMHLTASWRLPGRPVVGPAWHQAGAWGR